MSEQEIISAINLWMYRYQNAKKQNNLEGLKIISQKLAQLKLELEKVQKEKTR